MSAGLLVLCSLCVFPGYASDNAGATSVYIFQPDHSTIAQTGGIAGVHWTYAIAGKFRLTVDPEAGTASFDQADATATDDSPYKRTLDPNEVFNLTALAGKVVDETTIRFEGKVADGSSVLITLTFADGKVTLKGQTTPPPNSADFFVFTLDAAAQRQDAYPVKTTEQLVFVGPESAILQTGGIAGVHWTYRVEGRFRLTVDFDTHTASFSRVDATATDDSPYKRTLDPNEVFNLTGLTGRVVDETTIRFEGKAADGSSVAVTLTFAESTATLKGQTTPPPNSADFFLFTLDAVAQRRYAGGTGEPNDPFLICTAEQLNAIGAEPRDWDKHFKLVADINLVDLAGVRFNMIGYRRGPTDSRAFTGTLDGNGRRILNFACHSDANDAVGLLGYVAGPHAEVENLTLADPNVEADGADSVGSLVGLLGGGTVRACHVVGGNVFGRCEVGGLVGFCDAGSVIASSAIGIVGGRSAIGGLVGFCSAGVIRQSFSGGAVVGYSPADTVGGLVGSTEVLSRTDIANCYSYAKVTGTSYAGGLVGALVLGNGITNCYSTGAVSGTTRAGGLIGFAGNIVGYKPDVKASFWDIETSGQTHSAGGVGKTTAEMQEAATFLAAGWDFVGETANGKEDIWWMEEGKDYPRLAWERVLGDDFGDGKAEPLWMLYQPQPERVWLKEVNGRLEVEAIAQTENVDAIYAANGWRLDATKAFALRVDFHFGKCGTGDGRVTLGVTPSLDPSGMQWAELEAGCFDADPFFLYEVRDGSWVQERTTSRSSDDGTLYVSYNPDADELYFGYTGYGRANAWQTVPGLLKGRWAAPVYVILSGGSQGMALEAGDAWLDNFVLNAGTLAPDTSAHE